MKECNCPLCQIRKAIQDGNDPMVAKVVKIDLSDFKSVKSQKPEIALVANRDIKEGELVVLGKDVRIPSVEEFMSYKLENENTKSEIDKIWCEMMNADKLPTELDRATDAWHHAENLYKKGVIVK